MSKAEIEDSYKISRRIEGEERGLDQATMVFTSTQQEVKILHSRTISFNFSMSLRASSAA